MLFKRYANPLSLMSTYTLEGLADFVLRLFDQTNEDQLWEVWMHKDQENDFQTFKKIHYKKNHRPKRKSLSVEEEKEIIERNMQYIKPVMKGGE